MSKSKSIATLVIHAGNQVDRGNNAIFHRYAARQFLHSAKFRRREFVIPVAVTRQDMHMKPPWLSWKEVSMLRQPLSVAPLHLYGLLPKDSRMY
jgi:hypothetical protein